MRTQDRSEGPPENSATASSVGGLKEPPSAMQKRLQRLSRNVSEAIASLKNSLNLDSVRESLPPPTRIESCRKVVWCSVVKNLTQLYPGSQLPEKLVSNIRKHYDSLPLRFELTLCTLNSVYYLFGYRESNSRGNINQFPIPIPIPSHFPPATYSRQPNKDLGFDLRRSNLRD